MNFKGHLTTGFVIGTLFILITHHFFNWFSYDVKSIIIYAIIIAVYCLLPDSDLRNSTISYVFIAVSIIGMIVGYNYDDIKILYSSFALLVVTFIAWNMKHRGFIHSIVFNIIVSVPLIYFLSYEVAALAFICFYSHLVTDEEYFKLI